LRLTGTEAASGNDRPKNNERQKKVRRDEDIG
jgi:hypothetical protein